METIVEYQVKPGHFSALYDSLKSNNLINPDVKYKIGKTDYQIGSKEPGKIYYNKKTYNHINDQRLHHHIKKVKTIPLFSLEEKQKTDDIIDDGVFDVTEQLIEFKEKDLVKIRKAIKRINLSRQLRMKIQKAFYNFNNGIIDSALYIYHADFIPFMEVLKNEILSREKDLDDIIMNPKIPDDIELNFQLNKIEKKLEIYLKAFEEAYDNRILNNYQYEDINDYNIDFNSSITQILSTYDSLIKMLSPSLFDKDRKLLIRQNDINTVSNIISINYNVFHLLESPFIFNTVVKEILNSFKFNFTNPNSRDYSTVLNSHRDIIEEYKSICNENFDPLLEDFDFSYFEIDVIKYFYTFNANTELYVFWSWVHFLQNTSLYTVTGTPDERHFNNELIRIMLVCAAFDENYFKINSMLCPVTELYNYWERNFFRIKQEINIIANLTSFKKLIRALINLYQNEIICFQGISHSNPLTRHLHKQFFKTKIEDRTDKENNYYLKKEDIINKKVRGYGIRKNVETFNLILESWKALELFNLQYQDKLEKGESLIIGTDFEIEKNHISSSMILFFNCLSYTVLNWYYQKMDGEINLLRRDRKTGEPILKDLELKRDTFLLVDPNGEFFTPTNESRMLTMKFKHAVYHSLWHLGLVFKPELFNKKSK